RVLGAGVLVAVPPEPVAALGDVDLFPGALDVLESYPALRGTQAQVLAGDVQGVPGSIILLVADPDGKVVVDPAPRKQVWQSIARRILIEKVPQLDWADAWQTRAALI